MSIELPGWVVDAFNLIGLPCRRTYREIYLTDLRKNAPDKVRTVLGNPVGH